MKRTFFIFAQILILVAAQANFTYAGDILESEDESQVLQDVTIGSHVVTIQQQRELRAQLPKTTEEKKMFHWTHLKQGMRWAQQGKIDADEVKFYNTPNPEGWLQVHGPGVYLAESPISSTRYGDYPVVFTIPVGTLIYRPSLVRAILGWTPGLLEIAQLGESIPFIRKVPQHDWWITHHANNTKSLAYAAGYQGAEYKKLKRILDSDQSTEDKIEQLKRIKTNEGEPIPLEDPYLEYLISLLQYLDHPSLVRAIELNPKDPFGEFDPEHFHYFHSFLRELHTRPAPETEDFQIHQNGILGEGQSQEQWVSKQVNQVLPALFSRLSGHSQLHGDQVYRNERIRGGGDGPRRKFYATPSQFIELKNNRYLKVSAKTAEDGMGFWVSYLYPSVTNYDGITNRLSQKLRQELANLPSKSQLKLQTTHELNLKIVKELLTDLFSRYYGKMIDHEEFQRDLISIHPFSDFNGRTARAYSEIISSTGGPKAPAIAWSDFDLLMPISVQKDINQHATLQVEELRKNLLREMATARLSGRVPDYLPLPELKALFKPLNSFAPDQRLQLDSTGWEMIRQRNINTLLDRHFGHGWDIQTIEQLYQISISNEIGELSRYRQFFKNHQKQLLLKILQRKKGLPSRELKFLQKYLQSFTLAERSEIARTLLGEAHSQAHLYEASTEVLEALKSKIYALSPLEMASFIELLLEPRNTLIPEVYANRILGISWLREFAQEIGPHTLFSSTLRGDQDVHVATLDGLIEFLKQNSHKIDSEYLEAITHLIDLHHDAFNGFRRKNCAFEPRFQSRYNFKYIFDEGKSKYVTFHRSVYNWLIQFFLAMKNSSDSKYLTLLEKALHSPDYDLRNAAIQALSFSEDSESLKIIQNGLNSGDSTLMQSSAFALERRRDVRAIQVVEEYIDSDIRMISIAAKKALAQLFDSHKTSKDLNLGYVFLKHLKPKDLTLQVAAAQALIEFLKNHQDRTDGEYIRFLSHLLEDYQALNNYADALIQRGLSPTSCEDPQSVVYILSECQSYRTAKAVNQTFQNKTKRAVKTILRALTGSQDLDYLGLQEKAKEILARDFL